MFFAGAEGSGEEGIVANSPLTMKKSPGLPAGRAESFPVQGELCLRATSACPMVIYDSSRLASEPCAACQTFGPFFKSKFWFHVLFCAGLTRRFLLRWFGRRYLGLLLASLHPEIPSVKAGCHRTIPPLLHAYVGSPESRADILTQRSDRSWHPTETCSRRSPSASPRG